jgi:hypothetical protein
MLRAHLPIYCTQTALQAVARMHELEPRHISVLGWAFAVRKAYSPALYEALADRVVSQLGVSALEPHHCSLLAWSFAKQGVRHEALLQALGEQAAAVADRLAPQVCVWLCVCIYVGCCKELQPAASGRIDQ